MNINESAHDPLCPFHMLSQKPTGIAMSSCQCGLIARVREDERRQYSNYSNARNTGRRDGYTAALHDALIAVYEIQDDGDSSTEWDRDYDIDPTGDTRSPRIWLREAMAAIESLKGGR